MSTKKRNLLDLAKFSFIISSGQFISFIFSLYILNAMESHIFGELAIHFSIISLFAFLSLQNQHHTLKNYNKNKRDSDIQNNLTMTLIAFTIMFCVATPFLHFYVYLNYLTLFYDFIIIFSGIIMSTFLGIYQNLNLKHFAYFILFSSLAKIVLQVLIIGVTSSLKAVLISIIIGNIVTLVFLLVKFHSTFIVHWLKIKPLSLLQVIRFLKTQFMFGYLFFYLSFDLIWLRGHYGPKIGDSYAVALIFAKVVYGLLISINSFYAKKILSHDWLIVIKQMVIYILFILVISVTWTFSINEFFDDFSYKSQVIVPIWVVGILSFSQIILYLNAQLFLKEKSNTFYLVPLPILLSSLVSYFTEIKAFTFVLMLSILQLSFGGWYIAKLYNSEASIRNSREKEFVND